MLAQLPQLCCIFFKEKTDKNSTKPPEAVLGHHQISKMILLSEVGAR